jgi:putative two-component system response regulator
MLPDSQHLAVVQPLLDKQCSLVIHHSVADIDATASALFQAMPAISVMTLIWTCALTGVAIHVILARSHDRAERARKRSAADTLRQAQNLIRTRDAVIFGLAKLADSRDPETGDHLERISVYCTTLASALRRQPDFARHVTPATLRLIGISSALHDIGKVGIEDAILLKRGRLTDAERERMQIHTIIGGECLRKIEQRLGGSNFLQMAHEIAVGHHEWWDGTGYPHGLAGEAIPIAARIVALADVYDALSSRRVYKRAYTHEECLEIIRDQSGKQFDPGIVEVWMTVEGKFREIAKQYGSFVPEGLPSCADDAAFEEELERGDTGQREAIQDLGTR